MNSQAEYLIKEDKEVIPFLGIVLPYIGDFSRNLNNSLPGSLVKKLQNNLLKELSSFAEITLQFELDNFLKNGNDDFDAFIEKMNSSLVDNYPVLDEKLRKNVENFSHHILKILTRFHKDIEDITKTFNLGFETQSIVIEDIEASLGDGHNGEGTAMVKLSDGTKLIYKPRNIGITHAYNTFIDWVNTKLNTNLKTFKVLVSENYGWLEFVHHEELNSERELQEYYYKAGIILAGTMLLGSKDYHRENIIAAGKNPVLIDHETIIQPFLDNPDIRSWDGELKIPYFSVLETALIASPDLGIPLNCVGFGVSEQLEVTEMQKEIVHPNTIYSKRVVRFSTTRVVENNIPVYKNAYVFAKHYKDSFISGFSAAYDLFLASTETLKSTDSPLEYFKNQEVRYVWRPTFVYFKILKYLKNPTFTCSLDEYHSKLYELLSKAYKGEQMEKYLFILDFEMKQMLKGDIPIFNLGSTENFLEGNPNFKIFRYNCIENIYNRIDVLSEEHKKEQIEYIDRWLNI